MNGHLQFEEDFELLALGLLDGEEKAAAEAHVTTCPACGARLEAVRGRMALLGLAADPVSAPAGIADKVVDRFRAERAAAAPPARPGVTPIPVRARKSSWTPLWAAACFALLAFAGWFAYESRRLSTELAELEATHQQLEQSNRQLEADNARARVALDVLTAPDTVQVDLTPASAHPVPHGKAFFNPGRGLLFYAASLPKLPTGKTYELWLIPSKGAPIAAGIFNPDARGNGQVILPPIPTGLTAIAFAVTIEPAGGTQAPTGVKVLIGPVS